MSVPNDGNVTEEQIEADVDKMSDQEILQAIVDYYTQGECSSMSAARGFVLDLFLEEYGLKDPP